MTDDEARVFDRINAERCAERDRADRLAAENDRLRDALIWCSGSSDFQVGGAARVGYVRLVAPLLRGAAPVSAENTRLRAALQPFADFEPGPHLADDYPYYSSPQDGIKVGHFRAAKAALEET